MNVIEAFAEKYLTPDIRTIAVLGGQWGDEAKGKFVDAFGEWADVTARGTGGNNAGHTICHGDLTFACHLLPSSILRDGEGKVSIIGRGVALDPLALNVELDALEAMGGTWDNLRISHLARLVLPIDIALDMLGNGEIGTTGKGIGPTYESHVGRYGLTVNDVLNPNVFKQKLERNLAKRRARFRQFDPAAIHKVLMHPSLQGGRFAGAPEDIFNLEEIVEVYCGHGGRFLKKVVDTDALLQEYLHHKRVLLEGAQGILLSVDYGTQPFVTSSDCSLEGLCKGVGLLTEAVDRVFVVAKGPYMTRVGAGPFPTECGGERSAKWCQKATQADEAQFLNASINSPDAFEQGVAIRRKGEEYGTTTGRPRRTGWLDLPLLKYALRYAGSELEGPFVILTKADVLDECDEVSLCLEYDYDGDDYRVGDRLLRKDQRLTDAIVDPYVLEHVKPVYEAFPGWKRKLRGIQSAKDLPQELLDIIETIENECATKIVAVSVGPDRDDTVVL